MIPFTARNPLNESDIRPQALMAEQERRLFRDAEILASRKSEFVAVPCPACGSDESSEKLIKQHAAFRECKSCATVFISPRPNAVILSGYREHSESLRHWIKAIYPSSDEARLERVFRPRARKVAELCKMHGVRTGTVADIGAGYGTFCTAIAEIDRFEKIMAVEPVGELCATIRARGLKAIESTIENANLQAGSCDVVTAFSVIDHVPDPAAFLQACHRVLKPGGIAILTCPNVKGFDIQTMGDKSPAFDFEHLNLFNVQSFGILAERCGFSILELNTPGELDAQIVRNAVLSGAVTLEKDDFLRQILIERWDVLGASFQQFLADHALSSHLWFVGQRN